MKFTLSWLRDHLDMTASLDEICEGLAGVLPVKPPGRPSRS